MKFAHSEKAAKLTVIVVAFLLVVALPAGAALAATVNVVTDVVNTHGGHDVANDFIETVTGGTPSSFRGSTTGASVSVAASTTYAVSVTPGLSYNSILSPDCTGTLEASDTVTCTITLNDVSQGTFGSASPNLIANPGLETSAGSVPQGWSEGDVYGVNIPTYTYPATNVPSSDISDGAAASVSFPTYTGMYNGTPEGGDAKWVFTPVAVTAGRQYSFQDAYISNVPTMLTAQFFDASGTSLGYAGFFSVPATPTNTWMTSSGVFTVPSGAATMTVYHLISSAGTLTTDNYSLTEVPPPAPFQTGIVSLTFDDGFNTHATNAMPILDGDGLKATFFPVSHLTGFGVVNPSFEQGSTNVPTGWLTSGSNAAVFTYPVAGHTGNAAEVTASTTNSNAGWYFKPVSVLSDEDYTYGDWYKSTAESELYVQITTASGTTEYIGSDGAATATKTAFATLPAAADWTQYQTPATSDGTNGFYVPPEAAYVTVVHALKGAGTLDVDDVSFGAFGDYMTPAQVLSLQQDGMEVGGHTQTHADLTTLTPDEATTEISGGRQDFLAGGVTPELSFAYPYGDYNQQIENIVQTAGYTSARSTNPGFNGKNADKYALLSESVDADTPLSQVESWINEAEADHTWLILTFHQIQEGVTTDPNLTYGTTPEELKLIADYLSNNGIVVKTVNQALGLTNPQSLDVTVNVTNTNGGTSTPADVSVNVTGNDVSSTTFSGNSAGTALSLDAGAYSVSASSLSGYSLNTSADCVGSISDGETKDCVFTFSDIASSTPISTTTPPDNSTSTPPTNNGGSSSSTTPPVSQAVTLTPGAGALTDGEVGTAYGPISFTANDGDEADSFTFAAGTMPDGLTFATTSGTQASITGTPTTGGTFTFPVSATSNATSSLTISQSYSITVDAAPATTTTSTSTDSTGSTTPDNSIPTCPEGFTLTAGQCVVPPTIPVCPDGSNLTTGQCVFTDGVTATSTPTCATGTLSTDGTECDVPPQTPTCTDGYTLQGDTCVVNTPVVPPTPPVTPVTPTCDSGTHLDADTNQCVADPIVTPTPPQNSGSSNGSSSNSGASTSGVSGQRASAPSQASAPSSGGQVLGASTFYFSKNLSYGMNNNDVTELQKVLIADGYLSIPAPTGYFGLLTKAAVKLFQTANEVSSTGFVGPLTRAVLNKDSV